jgi:hypothetical protein
MEVRSAPDQSVGLNIDKSSQNDEFLQFVKSIVKAEVKNVFKGLSEEGVQAGKKDIENSRKKYSISRITKKIIVGDKGRRRMDPGSVDKIKAYIKSYLIHQFVPRVR